MPLQNADVSLLCVGTPSTTSGEANLTYIYRVVEDLIQPLKRPRRRGRSTPSSFAARCHPGRSRM